MSGKVREFDHDWTTGNPVKGNGWVQNHLVQLACRVMCYITLGA